MLVPAAAQILTHQNLLCFVELTPQRLLDGQPSLTVLLHNPKRGRSLHVKFGLNAAPDPAHSWHNYFLVDMVPSSTTTKNKRLVLFSH